jgi:hypothetical protein
VEGDVDEALVQHEDVLDHVPMALGLFVTIEIVPPKPLQDGRERALHRPQLLRRHQIGQDDDAIRVELGRNGRRSDLRGHALPPDNHR